MKVFHLILYILNATLIRITRSLGGRRKIRLLFKKYQHVLLFLPLSRYLVIVLLSLSGVYMQQSHQITNSHDFCMASIF